MIGLGQLKEEMLHLHQLFVCVIVFLRFEQLPALLYREVWILIFELTPTDWFFIGMSNLHFIDYQCNTHLCGRLFFC
jgi:hypothetical protein